MRLIDRLSPHWLNGMRIINLSLHVSGCIIYDGESDGQGNMKILATRALGRSLLAEYNLPPRCHQITPFQYQIFKNILVLGMGMTSAMTSSLSFLMKLFMKWVITF